MPYNTTAIPPRKEATGHNQLPLTRVKKIIDQDTEIAKCSNNAAFIITCAAEMFIQHLADAAHTQARAERKPRRNIQYKDVANAVSHQDSLEFLEDVVPKTVPLKKVRATAKATQARLRGDKSPENRPASSHAARPTANGNGSKATIVNGEGAPFSVPLRADDRADDPNEQLELEMRQAAAGRSSHDGDVPMSG
ncbi:DNA polymerase epsilon subunit C [Tolypocladium ophioglossoides CBS 100239]|uniref:DNA polymerase epsilon subunit C n=1 Tax=Tolypocladium ophioglossoides (strain CBS 100239) TaxID=1163406 RepID=A0A0L0N2Z1_TOLOC|nr:DNA polymerase epsilon subunit C [Tolypocladium ophioglossoides CBS 100239]